jgi:hypothetical protein
LVTRCPDSTVAAAFVGQVSRWHYGWNYCDRGYPSTAPATPFETRQKYENQKILGSGCKKWPLADTLKPPRKTAGIDFEIEKVADYRHHRGLRTDVNARQMP